MGREIKRVPLDFDWPVGIIWPGKTLGVCGSMEHIINDDYPVERCDMCRKWARLAGLTLASYNCPVIPHSEPPTGPAYQLWETVTKGSPCSPPFATPEELARYLVDNNVSSCGYQTESYETWLAFINGPGWSLSGVFSPSNGFQSGVAAAVALKSSEENSNSSPTGQPTNAKSGADAGATPNG